MSKERDFIKSVREQYLVLYPELAPMADAIETLAHACPRRNQKLPLTFDHEDNHVRHCEDCLHKLAEQGYEYPIGEK